MALPTYAEVSEYLAYNPDTGFFTWIKAPNPKQAYRIGQQAKGQKHSKGYRQLTFKGKRYLAHRVAWLLMTGEWPPEQIDHINHIRHDNRWTNLRVASHVQNHHNLALHSANKTGFRGVHFHQAAQKFEAYVMYQGKKKYLGLYDTAEEAATIARAERIKLHGDFAS